jgi:Holliday junction resolvase RusA-like endonuclease
MKQLEVPIRFIVQEYDEVSFTIPGKPFGKQRPRVVSRGGFARAYTPKETVNYENLVKISYNVENGNNKLKNNIEAEIKAYYPIPKSVSKKLYNEMETETYPVDKKPDCDNIAKAILDSLNNIAYNDDSQIYKLTVEKYYSTNPRVDVVLKTPKEIGNS